MPRPCEICKNPEKLKLANEMVAAGETDAAIVARLGVGRMAINRHRRNHVEAPARAVAAVANKGRDEREQREKTIAAAARGELDPTALLSLSSLTGDLRKALDRIERASDAAEEAGQIGVLSGLLQQLHRNIEARGKLAGVGGFAAARNQTAIAIGGGAPAFEPFVLRMTLGGRTETMVFGTENTPPFEVRDGAGQPFAGGGAIVTKAGEPEPEIMIVPRGWQPSSSGLSGEEIGRIAAETDEPPDDPESV